MSCCNDKRIESLVAFYAKKLFILSALLNFCKQINEKVNKKQLLR